MKQTPHEFAEGWYSEATIASALQGVRAKDVPTDIRSPEFAKWLTGEYRLAMARGIELGLAMAKGAEGISFDECVERKSQAGAA